MQRRQQHARTEIARSPLTLNPTRDDGGGTGEEKEHEREYSYAEIRCRIARTSATATLPLCNAQHSEQNCFTRVCPRGHNSRVSVVAVALVVGCIGVPGRVGPGSGSSFGSPATPRQRPEPEQFGFAFRFTMPPILSLRNPNTNWNCSVSGSR